MKHKHQCDLRQKCKKNKFTLNNTNNVMPFSFHRSPKKSSPTLEKISARRQSPEQSPHKASSPTKRKSPKKGYGHKQSQILKVKVTPPRKSLRSPSPVLLGSSKKQLPDVCAQSKSPKKGTHPKPSSVMKAKSTGAHGSEESDVSPPKKKNRQKNQN